MISVTNGNVHEEDSGGRNNDITESKEEYQHAVDGIIQWINNNPIESEIFFKSKSDRTTIMVGYAFVLCMNGVISCEVDKIEKARIVLKSLEKRCTAPTASSSPILVNNRFSVDSLNWLSNVRYKIFGNVANLHVDGEKTATASKSPAQLIEEEIILADTYMSMALLTFLTHDIAGLMKGSWLLRKAWKIYQKLYTHLYELYVERFGNECCQQPPIPLNYTTRLRSQIPRSFSHFGWIRPSDGETEVTRNSRPKHVASTSKSRRVTSASLQRHNSCEPFDAILDSSENTLCESIERTPRKVKSGSKSNERLEQQQNEEVSKTMHQYPKICSSNELTPNVIDSSVLKRLMGVASFGYGIFQLTASLLPAKLLKVISIFGFEGNRDIGVACLMFARLSNDMRATLATLALLWFYTFGTQLFRNEDGYSKEKIDAVANLLDENRALYHQSAIFLFFHGRLERMKANANTAVEYFEQSYRFAAQNELKLLCLHEIAWCKLIQLDFHSAAKYFNELRLVSVYSKAFYIYMTAICQGAVGNFDNLIDYREEISTIMRRPVHNKQSHVMTLLQNRVHKLPFNHNDVGIDLYWKYLCYEMLFLWSVLSNVEPDNLAVIIEECSMQVEPVMMIAEPMTGLRDLLTGCAYTALRNYPAAIDAYQRCIERRNNVIDVSMHISAFAYFDLAVVLMRDSQEKLAARKLLLTAQKFHNYDMENRLCVQIQQELKKISS